MKTASISVLLLCLTIPLLLVILLYLSLSVVSKQHNPFLPTYEFVVVKGSCRVAVFLMFNVIIITIFRRSSAKPSAEDSDWFPSSFRRFLVYEEAGEDGAKDEATCGEYYYYYSSDVEDGDDDGYHGYDGYEEDNDDDGGDDDDDDSDSEYADHHQPDKDLERRIEEFIAMNYKQRREEMVYERLLCMVPSSNS